MSLEIETINPSTGETINNYQSITLQELGSKIKRAHLAFEEWKKILITE